MKIDKTARAAARHKKTEAVDSYVAVQKDDPVHSHSDGIKTVSRSGVVGRNDKNVGHEAMQRARDAINRVESVTFADNRAKVGTNDVWFEENKSSVEQQIMQRIDVIPSNFRPTNERLTEIADIGAELLVNASGQDLTDFDNYRPVVDDDAEIYVPKSER
jgi:hypothetical protein